MYDIAHMKDPLKAAVADHFSHQAPTSARPQTAKLAAIGKRLYVSGDSATGVQACQSCHGANAEGQGNVPRLAGQHRDYLKTQLWDFNFATREHTVMNGNAMKLNPDQIDGLVAYLGAE
jgi:cytochrome c553